jgi:predicted nucleic acid-binding protein
MTRTVFYLDSCIWLNLFKKEVSAAGISYWELADEFVSRIIASDDEEIAYSGIVIKEIRFKLNDSALFRKALQLIEHPVKSRYVVLCEEDYSFARKLESSLKYSLSFYDCLHIALCKKHNMVLVTRDNLLLKISRRHVRADRPENL